MHHCICNKESDTHKKRHLARRRRLSYSVSSSSSSSSSSRSRTRSNSSSSKSLGHFRYRNGSYIRDYKIKRHISDGTFGRVLKVRSKHRSYAMKVVRRSHAESARQEADIIRHLNKKQPSHYFVELIDSFSYDGYYVLVFERLGPSLYDLLRWNHGQGLPLKLLQSVTKQLLRIIGFMHSQQLTHTDLKPENILFTSKQRFSCHNKHGLYLPKRDRITVIDLGGAMYDDEDHDCSLLFQTRKNEYEHLALMQAICGQFPQHLAEKASSDYFTYDEEKKKWIYKWPRQTTTAESIAKVQNAKPLSEIIKHPELCDLLQKMLEMDPRKRISCKAALDHPFFQLDLP